MVLLELYGVYMNDDPGDNPKVIKQLKKKT